MKKLSILLVVFLITAVGFAQEKNWSEIREAKAAKFAEMAAQEFDLDKKQQTALYERKIQHFNEQEAVKKKVKEGKQLTKEQKKKPNKTFGGYFGKLTGKSYEELKPFYIEANKAMKKIK